MSYEEEAKILLAQAMSLRAKRAEERDVREMLAKLRCAIDLEKLSAYELARLLDFGLAEREWGYLTSIYQDREV